MAHNSRATVLQLGLLRQGQARSMEHILKKRKWARNLEAILKIPGETRIPARSGDARLAECF